MSDVTLVYIRYCSLQCISDIITSLSFMKAMEKESNLETTTLEKAM